DERNTIPRSVYYNAKLMASQETRGENYNRLGRALSLFILDFILLPEEEAWYNEPDGACWKTQRIAPQSTSEFQTDLNSSIRDCGIMNTCSGTNRDGN
ncbi:MAG: hypothetical protein Q4C22_05965, partial [Bacillota bacterium]|nr:hypothetical protein [Bacillota bacterium]